LAIPALGLQVSKPSDEALASQSEPALATLARVRAQFPSTSAPAIVVATGPGQKRQAIARAAARLQTLVAARGIAYPPFSVSPSRDGSELSIELPLTGAGNNDRSRAAIATLRNELVPQTLGRVPGAQTAVTGAAAEDVDFTRQMERGTPYVIVFVL